MGAQTFSSYKVKFKGLLFRETFLTSLHSHRPAQYLWRTAGFVRTGLCLTLSALSVAQDAAGREETRELFLGRMKAGPDEWVRTCRAQRRCQPGQQGPLVAESSPATAREVAEKGHVQSRRSEQLLWTACFTFLVSPHSCSMRPGHGPKGTKQEGAELGVDIRLLNPEANLVLWPPLHTLRPDVVCWPGQGRVPVWL